jgi:hypothetical protein
MVERNGKFLTFVFFGNFYVELELFMIIQAINQYQLNATGFKALKQKPGPKAQTPVATDSFQAVLKKAEIREELLNTVKKKMQQGYYNSQTVLDDLSDSFAKAMSSGG